MVNCPECSGPISAGKVTINGVDYHPKCFFCKKCANPLKVSSYKYVKGRFYCLNCVDKTPDLYHTDRNESQSKLNKSDKNIQTNKIESNSNKNQSNTQTNKKKSCYIQ